MAFYKVNEMISFLRILERSLGSVQYGKFKDLLKKEEPSIIFRIQRTKSKLLRLEGKTINFPDNIDLNDIIHRWSDFDDNFNERQTIYHSTENQLLVKDTNIILDRIYSFLSDYLAIDNVGTSLSNKDVEQEKLDDLNTRRNKIKVELEKARKNGSSEEIERLESMLNQNTEDVVKVKRMRDQATADNKVKEDQTADIGKSFDELKKYTKEIEDEQRRIQCEYKISAFSILVIAVLLIISYGCFICYVTCGHISFGSFLDLAPYSLGFILLVGIFAVALYLKGRANKISIELNMRLFNIHYLEGLMKMTVKLSPDSVESSRRINNILISLEQSYINHVDDNIITDNQFSNWEKKELKGNPYLKLLTDIKGIVSKISNN